MVEDTVLIAVCIDTSLRGEEIEFIGVDTPISVDISGRTRIIGRDISVTRTRNEQTKVIGINGTTAVDVKLISSERV